MKRSLSIIVITNILLQAISPLIALWSDNGVARTFIVTAYYSPLPNQAFYLRGNYEDEVVLNGEWIRGASGKKVYPWMLAAPNTYAFGTRIQLDGIGLWIVEDRGGAIVTAGKRGYEYDRIDIWMGYGDEGLRRALTWGKRKVNGVVYGNTNTLSSIDFSNIAVGGSLSKKVQQNAASNFSIFSTGIGKDSDEESIKALQKFLKSVSLYDGDIDGKYNLNLINSIYTFQQKYDIVDSPDDIWAGYWGFSTRKKAQSLLNTGDLSQNTQTNQKEAPFDVFTNGVSSASPAEQIKELQQFFTNIEYYDGEISGNYKDISDIIINYQIENNLIKDETDPAAGYWGPKTRLQAKKDSDAYQEKKRKEAEYVKRMEDLKLKTLSQAQTTLDTIGEIKKWDTSLWVRELQKTLKKLGYFDGNDTAIFWEKTEDAIMKYQMKNELIQKETDIWAGKLWPKTKEILKNELADFLLQQEVQQNQVALK